MARRVKRLAVLGSTGSVGRQTLDVVRRFPDAFKVVALCAGDNTELLERQVIEFKPDYFSARNPKTGQLAGAQRISPDEAARLPSVDIVVAAMVGSVGMSSVMSALNSGKDVALANKEPVVIAGDLLLAAARTGKGRVLPIDSEPSAIWQCIQGEQSPPEKLIITASGGAFRDRTWKSLSDVTPEEALRHPTWKMGQKITIDSATLMNKAFEVIESHHLFGIPYDRIDVVIHRQSIIHSMVEFADGSVKAQMGPPDMRYPIQYALFHPERVANSALPRFDPVKTASLTFGPLDTSLYPCYQLALEYARKGATWPAVLAGADEAAVTLFLDGHIKFTDIPDAIDGTLALHRPIAAPSLEDATATAAWAYEHTMGRNRKPVVSELAGQITGAGPKPAT